MPEPILNRVAEGHYCVVTATCPPEDSEGIGHWISDRFQFPVLIEELPENPGNYGPMNRLTFPFPHTLTSSLQWLLFREAAHSLGCQEIEVHSYEEKDWQELWKEQGFRRFQAGGHLTVIPAWDEAPRVPPFIVIDPHLAFGTGWHETTFRCLELLVEHCPGIPGRVRIMDFGSGTGILGVAALRLSPNGRLVAIDHDPYAVDATRDNLAANAMEERSEVHGSWEDWESGGKNSSLFSLVIANVTGGVLVERADTFWKFLDESGLLILSGVSAEERIPVEMALSELSGSVESFPGERYTTYFLRKEKSGDQRE